MQDCVPANADEPMKSVATPCPFVVSDVSLPSLRNQYDWSLRSPLFLLVKNKKKVFSGREVRSEEKWLIRMWKFLLSWMVLTEIL